MTPVPDPHPSAATTRRFNSVALALWANAGLLAIILIFLVSRSGAPMFLSSAHAEQQPAIAGGGGVFIMPAQLAQNLWGCYLLDIDAETIVAYTYQASDHKLRFVAARSYKFDRRLTNYSTDPPPQDIEKLMEMQKQVRTTEQGPEKSPDVTPVDPRQ